MSIFTKTLFICWFGVFATAMGLSQIAPILPLYLRELGVSKYESVAFYSGLCFGITSLFVAIFAPIWGKLSTHFGCKIMLLRASLGMAVLTFLLAFATNVEQVVIIRALTGVLSGFISTASLLIALIAPAKKAAWALGLLSTASVSGNLIGPLFGGLFSAFLGNKALFIFVAFLFFISFLTTLIFIKEKHIKKVAHSQSDKSDNAKLNITLLCMLFCITFIVQGSVNAIMPIMTLFVEQIHHAKEYIAFYTGLVIAASGISNLLFASKIGKIADKVGAEKIIIICLFFCGLMYYAQSLANDIVSLIVFRFLFGMGLGGLLPCVSALLKKSTNSAKLGLILGFNQSAFALGNFMGATGGGYIASAFRIESVFHIAGFTLIFFAIAFLLFSRKNYDANFVIV